MAWLWARGDDNGDNRHDKELTEVTVARCSSVCPLLYPLLPRATHIRNAIGLVYVPALREGIFIYERATIA